MSHPKKNRPSALPPPVAHGFSDRLRWAIERSGFSQRDLAAAAGLSQSVIQHLLGQEGEPDPRKSTVAKLAQALRVQAGWLAFG